jgi:hypothetical protein
MPNFGRSHHAGLAAIVEGHEHGHERHHCFAASHIALQQAVHLFSRTGILPDLPDHTFLGIGKLKGKKL